MYTHKSKELNCFLVTFSQRNSQQICKTYLDITVPRNHDYIYTGMYPAGSLEQITRHSDRGSFDTCSDARTMLSLVSECIKVTRNILCTSI